MWDEMREMVGLQVVLREKNLSANSFTCWVSVLAITVSARGVGGQEMFLKYVLSIKSCFWRWKGRRRTWMRCL